VEPAAATDAATDAAAAALYGVVLYPGVPFGPQPRHRVDVYVPSKLYQQQQTAQSEQQRQDQQQADQSSQLQQQHQQRQGCQQGLVPVVFFVHGGIWVTGESKVTTPRGGPGPVTGASSLLP
jgi:acetyl esterase/lipase